MSFNLDNCIDCIFGCNEYNVFMYCGFRNGYNGINFYLYLRVDLFDMLILINLECKVVIYFFNEFNFRILCLCDIVVVIIVVYFSCMSVNVI